LASLIQSERQAKEANATTEEILLFHSLFIGMQTNICNSINKVIYSLKAIDNGNISILPLIALFKHVGRSRNSLDLQSIVMEAVVLLHALEK